jgi:hypothetical protein
VFASDRHAERRVPLRANPGNHDVGRFIGARSRSLWRGVSRVGVAGGGEDNADRGHDERYAKPEPQEHGSNRRADEE